jgi:hypothetical protein
VGTLLRACGVQLGVQEMCLVTGIVGLSTLLLSPPGSGNAALRIRTLAFLFGYSSLQGLTAATGNQVFLLGSMTVTGLLVFMVSSWRVASGMRLTT